MLLPNIIPLCLLCFHLIESHTPASLRAIAAIHNQRARAIANALNLRAKAQYNAAVARSRATNVGLLDHRVIRDSNKNLQTQEGYEIHPDANEEGGGFYGKNYNGDDYEQYFIPQYQETLDDNGNNYQKMLETGQGNVDQPQYSCMVEQIEEEIKPEDLPQISVNFNEDYEPSVPSEPAYTNRGYTTVEQSEGCPECQTAISGQENGAFPQSYYPSGGPKSAEPHLRPLGHIHSHVHSHFRGIQPVHSLQSTVPIPSTHLTPGVNLNVVQNQNAAAIPQFAAATIQPGYNSAIVNPVSVIHPQGGGLLHHRGIGVNINTGSFPALINSGHGTNIVQTQTVQTHNSPVPGGHLLTGTGVGGNSVVQTQNAYQGVRDAEPLDGKEMVGKVNNGGDGRDDNSDNERLGRFFTMPVMKTPEYAEYSDLNGPHNRQDIVRYLENEQIMHGNMMPSPKTEKIKHLYKPQHSKDARLSDANFENGRLGTFLIDPSRLEPIPALPENFVELDTEARQQAIENILETEQRNIKNLFGQIDGNQQHNTNNFDAFHNEDTHSHHHPDNPEFHPQENNNQDEFHHNIQDPEHFLDVHDSEPNMDVQDIEIPVEKLGNPQQFSQNWKKDDENISEMLSKFIENDPEVRKKIGMSPEDDATLGNLFQLPERRFSDDFLRSARSLNKTKVEELDKLLMKERELINSLKKNAKHDEDLMMIGYIGDSLIDDFEKRLNKTIKRRKREIGTPSLPFNRLILDPRTRLDIPKTLQNLGTVTKTAFEYEKAPLYHVRNVVGSAQDAVMAAMKIPTKNFLIPSQYEIINSQGENTNLGAINPSLLSKNGGENSGNQGANDGIIDTFNRVGSAVRGSVLSGQEALNHVGEMAYHAKSAIHSGRYATPRMILKQIPHITREPTRKAMIITPRIFDITENDGRVGSSQSKSQPDFVRLGHIFDAVGISNPNAKNVEFEKIVIEPRGLFNSGSFDPSRPSRLLKTFRNILEGVRVENANEEDFVGNALNTLHDVRTTVGADSLRDLILTMRNSMGTVLKSDRKLINNQNTNSIYDTSLKEKFKSLRQQNPILHPETTGKDNSDDPTGAQSNTEPKEVVQQNTRTIRAAENQLPQNQDRLGASLFPQELIHPFLGQMSEPLMHQPLHNNNKDGERVGSSLHSELARNQDVYSVHPNLYDADRSLGQILGAINPMMFEKMFNESMPSNNNTESPHAIFHHHHDGHSHGHHEIDDNELGTSMAIIGQMLKPFMGHASKEMQEEFFGRYRPVVDEDGSPQYMGFENAPEAPQWVDVLHPIQENDLEYDE